MWVFDLANSNAMPIKLTPPNLQPGDAFGTSVAIEAGGNWIAVGAPNSKVNGKENVGLVHVWKKLETIPDWDFVNTFAWDDLSVGSKLGSTVAIGNDTLLAGAPFARLRIPSKLSNTRVPHSPTIEYQIVQNHGIVATWMRDSDGNWNEDNALQPDQNISNAQFGSALTLEGPQAIIGAKCARASEQVHAGKAYIFQRRKSGWPNKPVVQISQTGNKIFKGDNNTISGNGPSHHFGSSACILANVAVVGTPGDSDGSLLKSGSINIYARGPLGWIPIQYISGKVFDNSDEILAEGELPIIIDDRDINDEFGFTVGIAGANFIVGAPKKSVKDQAQAGAVYVFESMKKSSLPQSSFIDNFEEKFLIKLVQGQPIANSLFGSGLACTSDNIAISAPGKIGSSAKGQVYIFNRTEIASETSWGVPNTPKAE